MEKIRTYQNEVSLKVTSIFMEVNEIVSLCCNNSDIKSDNILSLKFKGEIHQLALVLQYEDIINQSFLSLDAISDEAERIHKTGVVFSLEDSEKLSKLIFAVTENTESLIIASLENMNSRLLKLYDALKQLNNHKADKSVFGECLNIIESIRKEISSFLENFNRLNLSKYFSEISIPVHYKEEKFGVFQEETIVQRLSKNFRVNEHRKILNFFYPEESNAGESGVLEIF